MRGLVAATAGIWLLALVFMSSLRADAWRSPAVLLATLAESHPGSYRSVVGYAYNSIPAGADLAVRFDAFRQAATLDDHVVVPLMEMSKIAAALELYIGGGGIPPRSPGSSRPRPPIASMALSKDADHVAGLQADLDAEIVHRLSNGPLRTDSVVALVGLVDCAVDGSRECAMLAENIRRWHESAVSNERAPQSYRAVLGLSLAKYHAARGEYDEAVSIAHAAGELAAGNLAYRLQQATLLAWLERWDALEILLDDIEERFPRRAPADPIYRDLRRRTSDVVR